MASNDTLYMTLELKDNLKKQIQEDTKDVEKLTKAVEELNVDLKKIDADKIQKNLTKNLNDAEKAMFKLMEAKEKVDKVLSRNSSMRSNGFLGMNDSELLKISGRMDEIIDKILRIGPKAQLSGSAIKDLWASLSADITLKSAKSGASAMEKGLNSQLKERAKAEKEAAREIATAFEDADKAAKNNVKNQELVKNALARIATARASLSAASESATMQDQAHARLLMSLLDQLANKLNALKGQFLGERGILDGVLGSGYQGLMRNVGTATKDIIRNALNQGGMGDAEWEKHKAAAQAAGQHAQKLNELASAFKNLTPYEEKEAQKQNNIQARKQAAQSVREQAEAFVKLRHELLQTQAAELKGILNNGKGVLSQQQLDEARNALRGIVNEMITLKGVMASPNKYSAWSLSEFGRGAQNWSPIIANGQQILNTMSAVRQLSLEEEKLMQSIDKASNSFQNQNRILGDLQMMTQQYLSLWGAKDFLNNIIQIGGQLEMQRLSIGAILGDTAHANDLFEKIKSLAVQSPFGVVELDQYTKQLSAYGFKYNELYDMTKRLADISAGAGTDVGRLALALGHVRSEAALSGYTLRQFAMNNIPMVGELAKMLTEVEGRLVSVADVRKRVKNKEISYEDVEAVIKKLTDEGGMFYNMQEVVSQSVKARWKNLKDSLDIMYGEMAEAKVGGTLKETAIVLTNLSRHWKELFAVIKTGLVILGGYKAVMVTNTLLLGKEAAAVNAGIIAKAKADKANLKLASSYRLLTAEEARFNGITGEALIMANALALSEKKLTVEALARQVALGKLTKAEALQVVTLADLTAAERLHAQSVISSVYTYGRFTGVVNGLAIGLGRLGVALKSLVWNPLTAIFAVAGVATEMWQKNNEEVERAAELNDSLFNRAVEGIRNIKQMMGETGMSFTLNGRELDFGDVDFLKKGGSFEFAPAANLSTAEMISAIEKWTQFIKEYSANPNNILNASFTDQSGQVRDLAEQYELLGKAVGETAEAYVWLKEASDATQFAEEASNGGWLNDDLVENINNYAQDVKDYNDAISASIMENRQFWSVVLKAARAHTGFAGTLKREGIEAENLSGQIKVLIEDQERYAGAIKLAEEAANGMGKTLSEFTRNPTGIWEIGKFFDISIQDYYATMMESRATMEADMNSWAEGMKQRLQDMGWELKELSQGQMEAIGLAIAETVAKANKGTDEIRKEVTRLMREKMEIPIDADTAKAVAKIAGLKKSLGDLVGHEWTIDVKAATNFDDVVSTIRKSYKGAKEFFENTKPLAIKMGLDVSGGLKEIGQMQRDSLIRKWKSENPGKDSTMYEQFLDQWDRMAKAMNDAMGFSSATGISLTDPNKNKSKGSKEDKLLKQWKERKKALDEYYKLYEEYSKYMSDAEAIKKINDTGLIKGQDLPKNINDYLSVLRDFMDGIKGQISGTERQSFWDSLVGDVNKKDFDENTKEVVDAMLKQLEEELKKQGKQWDLFKKIVEATGDKKQAAQIAFGGSVRFDNFAEELRDRINEALREIPQAQVLGIDKLLGMDEKELEKVGIHAKSEILPMLKELKDAEQQINSEEIEKMLNAIKKMAGVDEQIAVAENKLAEARRKYGENSVQALALEKELAELRVKQLEESEQYLRFYSGIMGMTIQEAEAAGAAIKENLVKQLANGTINADKYLKSVKNIDSQLQKIRSKKGLLGQFASGGVNGVLNARGEVVDAKAANAAIRVQEAEKELERAREELGKATENGSEAEQIAANKRYYYAQQSLEQAQIDQKKAEKAQQLLGLDKEQVESINETIAVVEMFIGALDGVAKAFQQISEMFEALGQEERAAGWSDAADTLSAITSPLKSATNAVKSALNGDIGGAISGVVGVVTSPITAFAKLHDKKREREIQKSQLEVKKLTNEYQNLQEAMEAALGGIYTTGGYDEMLENLVRQREELQRQMDAESDKKDSDAGKIEDYKQQIKEMEDSIKNFALDMAKALYDIDIQSWASSLTDAVVDAWEKGEDAVDAYKSKVKEMMKDLTKNILAKKVMEKALDEVGLDELVTQLIADTSGKLDETAVDSISDKLMAAGDKATNIITSILDKMEANGTIDRGEESSSSSGGSSISRNITEDTGNRLIALVETIRADVSVNRQTLYSIMEAVKTQAQMPVIAQAQLDQLRAIAANTGRNADFADKIYSLLNGNINGANQFRVK